MKIQEFFDKDTFTDEEGDTIPKEKMIFFNLEDGRGFAVRPSGTETKIKFYLFYKRTPDTFTAADLPQVKEEADASLESLWKALEADIESRVS